MSALIDQNPKYQQVTVFVLDWDTFSQADVTKELGVVRRSTLVMFKGGKEIGRVLGRTDNASIEKLFIAATS
ncbi:MAG: thioredoxin family protein [Pseudomonadota bacterium]